MAENEAFREKTFWVSFLFFSKKAVITLTKYILLAGYGAGMDNPDFGKLLAQSNQNTTSQYHYHRLILEKDKNTEYRLWKRV